MRRRLIQLLHEHPDVVAVYDKSWNFKRARYGVAPGGHPDLHDVYFVAAVLMNGTVVTAIHEHGHREILLSGRMLFPFPTRRRRGGGAWGSLNSFVVAGVRYLSDEPFLADTSCHFSWAWGSDTAHRLEKFIDRVAHAMVPAPDGWPPPQLVEDLAAAEEALETTEDEPEDEEPEPPYPRSSFRY